MAIAGIVVPPVAVVQGSGEHGSVLRLRLRVLGIGAAVGLLSSVIPYRLVLEALRRIRSAGRSRPGNGRPSSA